MDDQYTPILTEEERAARRAQRAEVRKKKTQERRRRQLMQLLPASLLLVLLVALLPAWAASRAPEPEEEPRKKLQQVPPAAVEAVAETPSSYTAVETADTVRLGEELPSQYAVLIDLSSDTILAEKASRTVISPASMTKILTLLVGAEQVTDLDDTFTITIDITDYCFVNGCSVVGFEVGEVVTVRDLLYGTILPSGADASLGLATYVAGSQEAFVELMNEKLEELGISDTAHFTNCVGLYDENHHCTVYDMAVILKAAMENELCREILGTRTYDTAPTPEHPEGQVLSNWFLRRIEDKMTDGFEVIGAKTGYVAQSGSCAASYGRDADGREYICVTGNAFSSWQAIYDHVDLYQKYCQTKKDVQA